MKTINDIERFVKNIPVETNTKINETVRKRIFEAFEKSKQTKTAATRSNIWRIIMKNRITRLTMAAIIIIAVLVAIFVAIDEFGGTINAANVAFAGVVEDISNTPWLHLTLDVKGTEGDYECWLSIKRGIFAGRFDSGIIWRNYFNHQERIYVPATNKLYIRHFGKDLSTEDQPVLNYLKMLFSPEIITDATIIKRVKDFEDQKLDEYELMKKEDGKTARFRLLTDPDTNLLRNIEVEVKTAEGERILYLGGNGDYIQKGPSNSYDLGVPEDAEIINQLPTLEAKKLLATCRLYRNNFSSYIIAIIMKPRSLFGVGFEINYLQRDIKAGRYSKILSFHYGNMETDMESEEKQFEEDFDSALDRVKNEAKYELVGAKLSDGRNRYRMRGDQTPILEKGRGISVSGFRNIEQYGWPIVLPTGKIIEDEYSKENNLICLRAFGGRLYFDPEHDYVCVRRVYGRHGTDGHISSKAEEEIPENRYKQFIRQVTELGQTGNGLWYPRRVEGIRIHSNDQGEEISREVTYVESIYIKMVSDFPAGTFDPDNLQKVIE